MLCIFPLARVSIYANLSQCGRGWRNMVSQLIWVGCISLEILLLACGFRAKLLSRYPVFYSYVAFVLLQDIPRIFVYNLFGITAYQYTYWTTEFLCVLIGCGIIFEVYRLALVPYPGTARMARNVLALVFVLAVSKGIASAMGASDWWLEANVREIERALRVTELAAILGLVILFVIYAIPFTRNLRGLLLGYGLFNAVRILSLPHVPESGAPDVWAYLYSSCFLVALGIWLAYLWSYSETPAPKFAAARLENDYQRLAAATRRRLQTARGQLAKAVRS
jgi:hypothetical protein